MYASSKDVYELENGCFEVDASCINIPPGCVPRVLETDLGNTQPFDFVSLKKDSRGEVYACTYMQRMGCITLIVWND